MKRIVAAVLMVSLGASSGAAGKPLGNDLRSAIPDAGRLDGPGCAIDILKGGKSTQIVVAGAADIASRRLIDVDTQFYMASIAKQFTALAIAQLVVAGKISLNDDIRKFLPEMPRYQAPVTVYMLLHHTGGIRDMLTLGAYAGYGDSSDVSRAEALRLVYAQTDTVFPPGSQHRYSNSGYLLLSEIVARASGVTFADYMTAHIFSPLGMARTRVLTGARADDVNAAHGYARAGSGFRLADTHPYYGGAGGAIFTLNDLVKYDHDIQVGHRLWTPAIEKIMLDPGKLADGSPAVSRGVVYASGLGLNGPWVQHGGAGEGFKNMVAWLPGGRLSVHVLCNNGAVDPAKIAEHVVDALGGYPPLRTSIRPADGLYDSADLPVTYQLKQDGEAKLIVEIAPRQGDFGRKRTVVLTKDSDDAFTGEGLRIALDGDRAGFMLGEIRSRAGLIHFRRQP